MARQVCRHVSAVSLGECLVSQRPSGIPPLPQHGIYDTQVHRHADEELDLVQARLLRDAGMSWVRQAVRNR